MSKQPPPAPTVSAVGPCPTIIQIVGRPGTGSLPSTIAPPDHPLRPRSEEILKEQSDQGLLCLLFCLHVLNTILNCKIQLFQL